MALDKTLDDLLRIAEGKGNRRTEYSLKARISIIEKNFSEIKKSHINNKEVHKIESIRDCLKNVHKSEYFSKLLLKDSSLLNRKDDLLYSINLYLLHENQRKIVKKSILKVAFASMLAASSIFIPKITSINDGKINFIKEIPSNRDVSIQLFHKFNGDGKYSISPEKFEGFLGYEYLNGYALVTEEEFLENKYRTYKKPMMITYDDGDPSQIKAMEILKEFYKKHNDFGKALTLCINDPDYTFGLSGKKLEELYSEINKEGWKIALHTYHHKRLDTISPEQCINEEIEPQYRRLEHYLGEKILNVDTLACPYGILPSNENLEAIKNYVYHSKWGDVRIKYMFGEIGGIAKNSKDKRFNQWNIPRICLESYELK